MSLSGADAGKFVDIAAVGEAAAGELTFKAQPDYEAPGDADKDNVYEVTLVAADAEGHRATKDVRVTVTNADDMGTVTLSRTQPRVGVQVKATLSDPDGSISGLRWQWYRGTSIVAADAAALSVCADADSDNCRIKDATSDTYTPTADDGDPNEDGTFDDGLTLNAVASYTDGHDENKIAGGEADYGVMEDTRNKPPEFEDQDTETKGIQDETTTREVEENTKAVDGDDVGETDNPADNVGTAVMAKDPDPNADSLIYTLSGADAGLVQGKGQWAD